MASDALVILTTWPDAAAARMAAATLVEERLAACANVVAGVESIYRWEGKVERANEVLTIFKTTNERYAALEQRIHALHSYEVPEILALSVSDGCQAYLRWIVESCPPLFPAAGDSAEQRGDEF